MMTAQQLRLYRYIESCKECPRYSDIQAYMGLKSKSGVHRLIKQLSDRGVIRHLPYKRQAIEIVPLGHGVQYFVWDDEAKKLVPRSLTA